MNHFFHRITWILLTACLVLTGCSEGETVVVPDNTAPSYDGVASILVENYINRIYIDLLGREPLDEEMSRDLTDLRAGGLDQASREALVTKLQTNTDFIQGDSSYKQAYFNRFYDLCKVRLLEGVSEAVINQQIGLFNNDLLRDSLAGDWVQYQYHLSEKQKLVNVKACRTQYRDGTIEVNEIFGRMLYNYFYDQINMNSINFIRACFDDLFFRFHTQAEFDQSFPIIEYNIAGSIFGQPASNKGEYIAVLINSREYHEGMIRWAYKSLLARDPDAAEVEVAMVDFFNTRDFPKVQRDILVTDEYAGF